MFFCRPSYFPQKFVARPICRINISGAYFGKIEKMLIRPKNTKKVSPVLFWSIQLRKKRVLTRPYIQAPVIFLLILKTMSS